MMMKCQFGFRFLNVKAVVDLADLRTWNSVPQIWAWLKGRQVADAREEWVGLLCSVFLQV